MGTHLDEDRVIHTHDVRHQLRPLLGQLHSPQANRTHTGLLEGFPPNAWVPVLWLFKASSGLTYLPDVDHALPAEAVDRHEGTEGLRLDHLHTDPVPTCRVT